MLKRVGSFNVPSSTQRERKREREREREYARAIHAAANSFGAQTAGPVLILRYNERRGKRNEETSGKLRLLG